MQKAKQAELGANRCINAEGLLQRGAFRLGQEAKATAALAASVAGAMKGLNCKPACSARQHGYAKHAEHGQ